MPRVDIEKLRAGLHARRAMALDKEPPQVSPEWRHRSLVQIYTQLRQRSEQAHHSDFFFDALILELISNSASFSERVELFSRLPLRDPSKLMRLASLAAHSDWTAEEANALQPDDYSLVMQSMVFDGEWFSQKACDEVLAFLRELTLKSGSRRPVHNHRQLNVYLHRLGGEASTHSKIDRVTSALASAHAVAWPTHGFVLLELLRLLDPYTPTSFYALRVVGQQCEAINLTRLYQRAVVLRALAGDRVASQFAATTEFQADDEDNVALSTIYENTMDSFADPVSETTLLYTPVLALAKLRAATNLGATSKIVLALNEAYELDDGLVPYCDWARLNSTLPRDWPGATMTNIFCAALFDDPRVWRLCRDAAIGRGRGAFVTLIQQHIWAARLSHRHDVISMLVRDIRALAPRPAQYLFAKVSAKSVLERLPRIFAENVEGQQATGGLEAERRATLLRHRMVTAGEAAGLIDKPRADEIVDQEMRALWGLTWRERGRKGQIRVDDGALHKRIQESLAVDENLLAYLSKPLSASDVRSADLVLDIAATNIATNVIFGEGWSFAGSLSNNLRHGVLVPRLLRAFTDAEVQRRVAHAGNGSTHAGEAGPVEDLRQEVSDLASHYMAQYLMIQPEDELVEAITKDLRTELARWAPSATGDDEDSIADITQKCGEIVLAHLAKFMACARMAFNNDLAPSLLKSARAWRDAHVNTLSVTTQYIDNLEKALNDAASEVGEWLQISKLGEELDFKLDDVVQYEIQNFYTPYRDQMDIVTVCAEQTGGDYSLLPPPLFSGKYLDLIYQVVHNMVQNAVTHSGLAMQTRVELRCVKDGDDLAFTCENTFDRGRRSDLKAKLEETRKTAAQITGALKEGRSGFSKINSLSLACLNAAPTVEISDVTPRSNIYTVTIRWRDGFRRMVLA